MKSLKKTLVLLVVFSMILSTLVPAFAATDVYGLDCEEEVARMEALGIIAGYEDGSFRPDNTITRAEMAVIICKMVGIEEATVKGNANVASKFSDVPAGEWYSGYVNVASGRGLLSGFPDGTFRPSETLTMNQVLTLAVNALGRGEYVSTMGTWPANYIAEAAKLGLMDGVKTSDANRGNVAIICWNTLEAPYVWDVGETVYAGDISLSNSGRSLLSIHFRDYVYGDTNLLKEAEYMTVSAVPATDGELGEYQVRLTTDDEYADAFWNAFANRPKRGTDEKEATVKKGNADDGYEIVAYAPGFENLDSLYGKVVTVIFGEDNKVVSIRVVDETVEDETITAFKDSKLTIGGETFKFATDARVFVNTVEITNANKDAEDAMDDIATELGIKFDEKYNKTIKASVVLNSSNKVSRLDLFVSGTYDLFLTKEAIVEKVRNEVISLSNNEEIDYSDDVDEDDLPRFIKDGAVITADEIEVGDVLTYYYKNDRNETITTVYVSSSTATGELKRVSKKDLKLTVDDESYYSSMNKLVVTSDKISDAEVKDNADNYIGEEVEIYLNIYGEYVLISSEKASENWTFGILTTVRDTEEDDEDDDVYYIPVRILLADGTTSREYKFILDVEDDDVTLGSYTNELDAWEAEVEALEGKFIVFSANANKEIEYMDAAKVTAADLETFTEGDYIAKDVAENLAVDDDRQRIDGKIFSSSTVIFNTGNGDKATTSKSWKMLIENDQLAQDATLVYEKDSKTLSYVLINVAEDQYAVSDAEYAIVETEDYKEKRGTTTKKYTELLTVSGIEEFEAKELSRNYTKDLEDYFVEYALSGSKLDSVSALINLPEFKDLKAGEAVTDEVRSGSETKLVVDLDKFTKKNLELSGEVKPTDIANVPEYLALFGDVDGEYYIYEIVLPTGDITIVQENEALEAWSTDPRIEEVNGVWTKTATYAGVVADETLAVPVKEGTNVKVTITTEDDKELVYEINATELTLDSAATATTATSDIVKTTKAIKANFKVIDTQKLLLEYEDDEDEVESTFGEVILDEDVIVYDARNGEIKEVTFADLKAEVAEDGYVYVIPFANEDAYRYGYSDVEANILVIVD